MAMSDVKDISDVVDTHEYSANCDTVAAHGLMWAFLSGKELFEKIGWSVDLYSRFITITCI